MSTGTGFGKIAVGARGVVEKVPRPSKLEDLLRRAVEAEVKAVESGDPEPLVVWLKRFDGFAGFTTATTIDNRETAYTASPAQAVLGDTWLKWSRRCDWLVEEIAYEENKAAR